MKRQYGSQIVRRVFQLGSLLFVVYAALLAPWRNFKHAHNSRRLVALMEGDTWGWLYGFNEDVLTWFGEPAEASLGVLGVHGGATVFGISLSDPVMAISHLLTTGFAGWGFVLGALIPVALAIVLGKFFCSHLCPMRLMFEIGQYVRRGLIRLGIPLPDVTGGKPGPRFGGWVLLGGLAAAFIAGPGVWMFALPYYSLSAGLFVAITSGALSALLLVATAWWALDVLLAPGFFCHSLCPTGFSLEKFGRWRILNLRTRANPKPCPRGCRVCEQACPYHLSPREETHSTACDNCAKCAVACPLQRLERGLGLPTSRKPVKPSSAPAVTSLLLAIGVAVAALAPTVAEAHHNKGLPHYGYYENYPQVPTEEYILISEDGRWEMGATFFNFQGLDRTNADTPNDVKIYLYIYDLHTDQNYVKEVDFEIRQGDEVIATYLRTKVDEEATYSTRETLPHSGNYELVANLDTDPPRELVLPFYVDLASDGVDWGMMGSIAAPVLVLFVVAWFGRRRRGKRPRRKKTAKAAAPVATVMLGALALAFALGCSSAESPPTPHAQEASAPSSNSDSQSASAASQPSSKSTSDVAGAAPGTQPSTMQHYETEEGAVMVMGGIPLWLFLLGIVGIIVISFVGVEWLGSNPGPGFRRNLVKFPKKYRILRSRWFQVIPQLAGTGVLVFLVYAGLFGSRVTNITPVAVWTVWWAALIFFILMLGPVFCFACPWDGVANLMTRLRAVARVEPLSLGLTFPSWLKNVYPAIALFVGLTWLELGYGVTTNPRTTAYMALGMVAMAVAGALLWDGKKFCHYMCPVGRISGIYANFSPVEIRAARPKVCARCTTEECLHGSDTGYPCPTGISLKTVSDANYCTMCTECFKSCPKYNVALNIRPFGADLRKLPSGKMDEAWLALALLSLTLFHGLSMTPAWENFEPGGTSLIKWLATTFGLSHTANFTVAMVGVCAIPIGLYWLCTYLGSRWAGAREITPRKLFVNYAFSLLPVALFYHLAHNLMHLLGEGAALIPLIGDPLGTGANFLGLADYHVESLVSETTLSVMQVVLILVGHFFGIVTAHRIGHKLYSDKKAALRSQIPMLVMMILISLAGLGLMHMDMNMRIGRM